MVLEESKITMGQDYRKPGNDGPVGCGLGKVNSYMPTKVDTHHQKLENEEIIKSCEKETKNSQPRRRWKHHAKERGNSLISKSCCSSLTQSHVHEGGHGFDFKFSKRSLDVCENVKESSNLVLGVVASHSF